MFTPRMTLFCFLIAPCMAIASGASVAKIKAEDQNMVRFASEQIRSYEELLAGLVERAENTTDVDPAHSAKLKGALVQLEDQIENTRVAKAKFAKAQKQHPKQNQNVARMDHDSVLFVREDLKSSLFSLQDAAAKAGTAMMDVERIAGTSTIVVQNDGLE